jgi:CheY-like chemotaxis protein
MEAKQILLVDDNPGDVELTLIALAEYNLANHITVARDGAEALDYLYRRGQFVGRQDDHPVLVLLDLKMPKVDGIEVLRQVKSDPDLKHIPVVVLPSSSIEQDIIEGYGLGVTGYVVKPVTFDKLVEAVRHLSLFWVLTGDPPPDMK